MSAVKPLVKEINQYLNSLNLSQQQAVLAVVKTFAKEEEQWDDKTYIKEMNKRFAELETGKVKGVTLNMLEANARKSYKSGKKAAL
jgi:hypothetical protein